MKVRLTSLAVCMCLLCSSEATAGPPEGGEPFGMNARFYGYTKDKDGRVVSDASAKYGAPLAAIGVQHVRRDAEWYAFEETRSSKFGAYSGELQMTMLLRQNLRWSPVLNHAPAWANGGLSPHTPPRDMADYGRFAQRFAQRYGRGGSFFREVATPAGLPYLPVTRYELWNEPNFAPFWQPAPDPASYADLFVAGREGVKTVDPAATVIFAGLAPYRAGDFVREAYTARPALRGRVDGFGLHPYGPDAKSVIGQVRAFRATLDELGERSPIYITEIGWPTHLGTDPLSAMALPQRTRAGTLRLITDALMRADCGVATIEPFDWEGGEPMPNPEFPEQTMGMFGPDHTPTSRAYADAIRTYDPSRSGTIPVCSGGRAKFADTLRLRVRPVVARARGRLCVLSGVTYGGNPINGARVTLVKRIRKRNGRRKNIVLRSTTSREGLTYQCLTRGQTRARGERTIVRASISPFAASRERPVR